MKPRALLEIVPLLVLAGLAAKLGGPPRLHAADWPQYRGANHDAISTERVLTQWTGDVTNPVWRVSLTNGLTSLTVAGGRVFTQVAGDYDAENQPHREFCLALNASNGAVLWSTEVEAQVDALYPHGGVGFGDDGPRTTPAVDGGSVYVLTSYLKLHRLNATNGTIIWSTNLVDGLGGAVIPWQNAASPVLEDGRLFLNAGTPAASLMAFNTANGALLWRSQDEPLTHSTPVLATIHGTRHLIFATGKGLVAVHPQTGALLWRHNYPFSYSTSLAASPAVHQDIVFLSAYYAMGSFAIRVVSNLSAFATIPLWTNRTSQFQNHWSTPVCRNGAAFGTFTPDNATAQLKCVDLATGALRWAANNFGRGSTLLVGTNLIVLTESGDLVLVAAQTNSFSELGRFRAIPNFHTDTNKCWNALALSDGQVYVRSTAYAARYNLAAPVTADLKISPPTLAVQWRGSLAIRAADGAPISAARAARLELRASTDLALPPASWSKVDAPWLLSNGVVHMAGLDATPQRQFFLVREANPDPVWPRLQLDAPQLSPQALLQFLIRSESGTVIDSNRLTGMELRAATNLGLPRDAWGKLPASWVWSNGVVIVNAADAPGAVRFFVVSEPSESTP